MNVELYIDNQLCDLPDPSKMNIVLKRVFIKPSELSTKDAQKSYNLTLPPTPRNNAIFHHINIEDVPDKFSYYPDARLFTDGILILDGKFRLSGIGKDGYQGNLGVPAPLTVKEIFGNTTMNQIGNWLFKYYGIQSISTYNDLNYNDDEYGKISPFIIPFALYGLMPYKKYLENMNINKEEINQDIEFRQEDFPPSVNCLHLIKEIFTRASYSISGNAFDDERLKNLYVSYKNAEDYKIEWNVKPLSVKGSWSNYDPATNRHETQYGVTEPQCGNYVYKCISGNLFIGNNVKISQEDIKSDDAGSVTYSETPYYNEVKFRIPYQGLYKIDFSVKINCLNINNNSDDLSVISRNFDLIHSEVKLVRYQHQDNNSFLWGREKFDNTFFSDNINNQTNKPKIKDLFPREGEVHFIDPKQNPNLIGGFSWGRNNYPSENSYFVNPVVTFNKDNNSRLKNHNVMAASGRKSWDDGVKDIAASAIASPGYMEWDGSSFVETDQFKIDLINAPRSYTTQNNDANSGSGYLSQIMSFEAGEYITIMFVSNRVYNINRPNEYMNTWASQKIEYELTLTPFMRETSWLKVDPNIKKDKDGGKDGTMNWNDDPTFNEGMLNLSACLPQKTKIDEWLNNFCKTFNLELINTGKKNFELNIKNKDITRFNENIIDLDKKTAVALRSNSTLGLPRAYQLGFEVETSEQGYFESQQESEKNEKTKITNSGMNGGGEFLTGSTETSVVEQKSGFSYCWYKKLRDVQTNEGIKIPVITDHEIWDSSNSYKEMKDKRYFDLRQRFWYRKAENYTVNIQGRKIPLAYVKNSYDDENLSLTLDYEDKPQSIARNYFLLMDNRSSYTSVSCYLTPEEYTRLAHSYVRFNGDLYVVAEVDGYDPLGLSQAKLKLIRKTDLH